MKRFSLIYFLLIIADSAYAQHSLSGTVILPEKVTNGEYASIYIPDLKTGTSTDSSGFYRIEGLPPGKFLVECRMKGYGVQSQEVEIKGDVVLDFILDPEVVEISEVTITGSTHSTGIAFNPLALKTMSQEKLFEQGSSNLIESISKTPGVNQLSTGSAVSKPIIRGLGYNRIVSLYNGIRQEGQQWGDEHGIEIDEFSIDRVEIIKGPGSLIYGSDALAGVVNFLSPNALPLGQIKGGVTSNYQTNHHLMGYSVYNAGNIKGFNWLLRGSFKKAGNFRNAYDGYVYNSGFEEKNINGYLGINKRWGYSHVHFSSFNQLIAMPEGERDSLGRFIGLRKVNDTLAEEYTIPENELKMYRYDVPRQSVIHHRISNNTRFFFGRSSLNLLVGFQQSRRKEFGEVLAPNEEELAFTLNTFNYDLRYQLPEKKDLSVTIGTSGMHQTNANAGEEVIIPEYTLIDVGAYFFARKKVGNKLNISGGVRYDVRNVSTVPLYVDTLGEFSATPNAGTIPKFKGVRGQYGAVSGSLGAAYAFSESFTGKLNLARGFRSPNIAEIGSNGKHEGALRYEVGDYTLKPETSLQLDLGLNYTSEHLSADLAVFYNDIQRYIYMRKLSNSTGGDSIVDPNDPAPVFVYTQGDAYLYGGEFSMDVHPHPLDWLHIENAFSTVTGVQKNQPDSMQHLPFIPAARYQGELRCEVKKVGKLLSDFYFSLQGEYFFRQDKVYSAFGTETPTVDYWLFHTGLGGNLVSKKGKTIVRFSFQISNLLDKAYQSHLNRLKYAPENTATQRMGIYNMGRNFSIKLFVPLDFKK